MLGEIFSAKLKNFNYYSVLKNKLSFQEKSQNQRFFLSSLSKKISITEQNSINEANSKPNNVEKIEDVEKTSDSNEMIKEQDEAVVEKEKITQESDLKENEETVATSLPTSVIQANNLPESYNTLYGSVKIKNETDFNLSEAILTPDVDFSDKTNIIIFHTHTCESYTPTEANSYVATRKFSNNRFKLFRCKSWKCVRGKFDK